AASARCGCKGSPATCATARIASHFAWRSLRWSTVWSVAGDSLSQQSLYFRPLPQGHGWFRRACACAASPIVIAAPGAPWIRASIAFASARSCLLGAAAPHGFLASSARSDQEEKEQLLVGGVVKALCATRRRARVHLARSRRGDAFDGLL